MKLSMASSMQWIYFSAGNVAPQDLQCSVTERQLRWTVTFAPHSRQFMLVSCSRAAPEEERQNMLTLLVSKVSSAAPYRIARPWTRYFFLRPWCGMRLGKRLKYRLSTFAERDLSFPSS
jgi:hypothetical protein